MDSRKPSSWGSYLPSYSMLPSFSSLWASTKPQPPIESKPLAVEDLLDDWSICPINGEQDQDQLVSFNVPATACSKPITEISYDDSKNISASSHAVYIGNDINGNIHFIKEVHTVEMMYCEAFLGHLYSLSTLYGFARAYVRFDENNKPVKLSSKGLRNFQTFKDIPLTQEDLNDPIYRKRFTRILAIFRRMQEDDGHRGNITRRLEVFDADCGLWKGTRWIKGARSHVDDTVVLLPIKRDTATAFNLKQENDPDGENDIRCFPNGKHIANWYFPSQENKTSVSTDNPWTASEVKLVCGLEGQESLETSFEEYLDWMLDLSIRLPHIAALNIPADLKVPNEQQSIIDLYCSVNKEIDEEYWDVLPGMCEFREYLRVHGENILVEVLARAMVRNARLKAEQKEAFPCDKFNNQFVAALVAPTKIIERYNLLIARCQPKELLAVTYIDESMMLSPDNKILSKVAYAEEIIIQTKANSLAKAMIEKERKIGNENWREFLPEVIQAELNYVHNVELNAYKPVRLV